VKVANPPTGGGWPPLGHGGGSATTKLAGLVVAEPLQWPKGVAGHPLLKKKKKRERRRFPTAKFPTAKFIVSNQLALSPPVIQPSCVVPTTCFGSQLFSSKSKKDRHVFFFFNWGWSSHPHGWWWPSHPHGWSGGGRATPMAGLVVAEPPPWPRGGSATFTFFFSLTGGGPATPLGHWGG
jgi:hypothetical protein